MSSSELGDERRALLAKTAQLRELRLAKEAADKQAAEVAAAEKPVKAAGKRPYGRCANMQPGRGKRLRRKKTSADYA